MSDTKLAIEEAIDSSAAQKSIEANIALEIKAESENYEFNVDVDELGQVVFTPIADDTSFTAIEQVDEFSEEIEHEEDKVRFMVKLSMTAISDTDNFDFFCNTDDVGQAIITPDDEQTAFISVSINDSLNLIATAEESVDVIADDMETEEVVEALKDKKDDAVSATVIHEEMDDEEPYDIAAVEHDLKVLTNNFTLPSGTARCGFEQEAELGVEVLVKYYNNVDFDQVDDKWFEISFSERKLNEEVDMSSPEAQKITQASILKIQEIINHLEAVVTGAQELQANFKKLQMNEMNLSKFIEMITACAQGTNIVSCATMLNALQPQEK